MLFSARIAYLKIGEYRKFALLPASVWLPVTVKVAVSPQINPLITPPAVRGLPSQVLVPL